MKFAMIQFFRVSGNGIVTTRTYYLQIPLKSTAFAMRRAIRWATEHEITQRDGWGFGATAIYPDQFADPDEIGDRIFLK